MFDIDFLDETPELQEDGSQALRGRIVLGEYAEEFLAPLDQWAASDYQRQWLEATRRVVEGGHDRTCFLTSTFQFIWTMWRHGNHVRVQEKLLIPDTLLAPFDQRDPYGQIGECESLSADGQRISEWQVTVDDLREFLTRREADAGRGRTKG